MEVRRLTWRQDDGVTIIASKSKAIADLPLFGRRGLGGQQGARKLLQTGAFRMHTAESAKYGKQKQKKQSNAVQTFVWVTDASNFLSASRIRD